jgi:hypothetical protein
MPENTPYLKAIALGLQATNELFCDFSLLNHVFLMTNTYSYQEPLADAIKGAAPCAMTLCEPKLTGGKEIVRELPRPLSKDTFIGFDDDSIA